MSTRAHTTLARALLVAATVCLGAVLLRNLGVTSKAAPALWDNLYYVTEVLCLAVLGLRVLTTTGPERAAWAIVAAGLIAYFAGDIYYAVALPVESPPFPSLADAG